MDAANGFSSPPSIGFAKKGPEQEKRCIAPRVEGYAGQSYGTEPNSPIDWSSMMSSFSEKCGLPKEWDVPGENCHGHPTYSESSSEDCNNEQLTVELALLPRRSRRCSLVLVVGCHTHACESESMAIVIRIVEVLDECRGSMRGFVLVAVIMMVSCCFTGCLENEEEDCCVEENVPPSVVNVNIGPDEAFSTYELTCDWIFNDEEGGEDSSYVTWSVNGIEVGSGTSISGVFSAGDTVTCTVTANDGEIDGNSASDSITIFEPSPPCPEGDKELGTEPGGFENFVTREGDRLRDGGSPFKFVSFNIPTLHVNEDGVDPSWHITDPWEQEDALASVSQMGGNVVRIYTLSVGSSERHIVGLDDDGLLLYNEELFVALDHAVALASKYCIRLIIPFVDNARWWGGIEDYVELWNDAHPNEEPLQKEDFWSHPDTQDYYLQVVDFLLNRENTVTGIVYKDDTTILAWETGNELAHEVHKPEEYPDFPIDDVAAWTALMAAEIKEKDPNHLLIDGRYGVYVDALLDENIDIVSNHYYKRWEDVANYTYNLYEEDFLGVETQMGSQSYKPLLNGEYGFVNVSEMEYMLDLIIHTPGITGALIWSLRFHDSDGGFYFHPDGCAAPEDPGEDIECEDLDGSWTVYAYHWPGFSTADQWDETEILWMIREKAFSIRGLEVPDIEAPIAPYILEYTDGPTAVPEFVWRGSTGASEYSLWKSESEEGDWVLAESGFNDAEIANTAFIADQGAEPGTWYYCMKAHNQGGSSDCSLVVGPITIR